MDEKQTTLIGLLLILGSSVFAILLSIDPHILLGAEDSLDAGYLIAKTILISVALLSIDLLGFLLIKKR